MYNDKVKEAFANPKNVGFIEDADGVGKVGNAACGDIMEISLKIKTTLSSTRNSGLSVAPPQ